MPTSDPLEILIASDAHNTRKLLLLCEGLSHEQFHRPFEIGLGTLHMTFTHIVSAMRRWTDRLAGRAVRPMLHAVPKFPQLEHEARDRTPTELLALLAEAERDLMTTARRLAGENALGTTLSLQGTGEGGKPRTYTFTRGCVLVHVTTHGYHHRAQCMNMLRHLKVAGVSDRLPDPSAVDWQADTELPPVTSGA